MGRRSGQLPALAVFDLDGTLIDSEPISLSAWVRAFREFGLELDYQDSLAFLGLTTQSMKELVVGRYGDSLPFEEIFRRKREIASAEYARGLTLKKGVPELLDTLEELSVPACVATSSNGDRAAGLLKQMGLLHRFAFLISGGEVKRSKPHPEIFLSCFAKAGVTPEYAFVVEDSRSGIEAARASGAFSVLVPDLVAPDEEMKANSDLILSDLTELSSVLSSWATC